MFYDIVGVDIVLTGHEHIYERYWPIYDFHVKNGSSEEPYTDPGAPVHVVTGAAVSECNYFLWYTSKPIDLPPKYYIIIHVYR